MAGLVNEWITVSDFTPGIHGDFHGAVGTPGSTTRGSILRDGAATIEHTYGCRADQSGALVPLPAKVAGVTQTLLPAGNANATTSYYPSGLIGAYLIDACYAPFFFPAANSFGVYTLWTFMYSTGGTGASYKQMTVGVLYVQPAATVTHFFWESSDPTTYSAAEPISSGSLCASRGTTAATYPLDTGTFQRFVAIGCHRLGAAHASAAIPAAERAIMQYDTDISTNYPFTVGYVTGLVSYPDITGLPFTNKFLNGITGNQLLFAPRMVIEHQGRLIVASLQSATMASNGVLEPLIGYSRVNDPNVLAAGGSSGGLYQNRGLLEGFGGMASLTSDELLLLAHQGGALLIRGDINNPTVVQLPFVESTHGVATHPAITPLGVVYGSRSGVFAWSGGDTSNRLSRQLDGMFWDHATGNETYENTRGRLCWWHPYVCVPGGFLFDSDTEAWWRLVDPSTNSSVPYNVFVTDPGSSTLYAFPYKLTATQNTVYDTYSPSVLSGSYSWRSHPLLQSRDRVFTASEVELVAANSVVADATVRVTLEGIGADGQLVDRVIDFTLTGSAVSGGRPQIIRQTIPDGALAARYIQLRIEATSGSTYTAPKIMSIGVGVADRSRVQRD